MWQYLPFMASSASNAAKGAVRKYKTSETIQKTVYTIVLCVVAYYLLGFLKRIVLSISYRFKSVGSSMTDESAKSAVTYLLDAFDNVMPYTPFNGVLDVFQGKSIEDYYKVFNAFGMKSRDFFGTNTIFGTDKDLTEWITLELSSTQKEELKTQIPWFNEIL